MQPLKSSRVLKHFPFNFVRLEKSLLNTPHLVHSIQKVIKKNQKPL